jgi:hypothetical protein
VDEQPALSLDCRIVDRIRNLTNDFATGQLGQRELYETIHAIGQSLEGDRHPLLRQLLPGLAYDLERVEFSSWEGKQQQALLERFLLATEEICTPPPRL